jgi:hypothetical protein
MDRLDADQRLNVNDQLISANSRAQLTMQGDGNLVLYRTDDGRALWASDTSQQPVTYTVMQGDGNLVVYSADGQSYWATGTDGHPGAWVILQGDANLVVYDSNGSPLWASNTPQPFGPAFVPNFLPTTHAPLFSNSTRWPPGTQLLISVMGLPPVTVDTTQMGLCGGMSFLTRDIVESGTPQLRGRTSTRIPVALAQHILARLLDSFSGPTIVARWLSAIQALDHDTVIGGSGLFRQTLNELPGIIAEVDAGRLCPIGIVLVHSYLPWDVFQNHVVLVWGYETHGDVLTLHTYDCNFPNRDNIVIQLDISSPTPAKTITTNGTDIVEGGVHTGALRGFFQLPYAHRDPSPAYIDNSAAAIGIGLPVRIEPGALATVRVNATNTGSTTWTSAAAYRLGSQAPQDNTTWGTARVNLQAASVDPEQTSTFTFQITAPSTAGRYQFCWQTVREGIAWFGHATPAVPISVGSDVGLCDQLHQQAQSLAAQLEDVRAQIDTVDRSDLFRARDEVSGLGRLAQTLETQLTAVEAQQQANGCAPG